MAGPGALTRCAPRAQRYDMPLRVERELALERLSQICAQKFFSVRATRQSAP